MTEKKIQQNSGFTLVELIVSMGLFIIIATASVGALLTVMDSNRKAKTIRIGMDNLNIAIERMVRELRTGAFYDCPFSTGAAPGDVEDCDGGSSISFLSQDGDHVVYRENSGTIERSADGGVNFSGILAPNIDITDFTLYVNGSTGYGSGDQTQSHALISIEGSVIESGVDSVFRVQTMATQRSPE